MLILYAVVLVTLAACGASRNEVKVDSCAAGGELCLAESTEMLVDPRDGQIYKTVKIGNQIWMAENLNYETTRIRKGYVYCGEDCDFVAVMGTSFCYDDHFSNCAKYGRLYMWNAAKDACPEGWHLPDTTEWKTLFATVGGMSVAGNVLKSTYDWSYGGQGTDKYVFSILPSGAIRLDEYLYGVPIVNYDKYRTDRNIPYDFFAKNEYAAFWSSIEKNKDNAYSVTLSYYRDDVGLEGDYKGSGFSVRCVKNDQSFEQQNSSSSLKTVMKNAESSSATSSSSVKFPPSNVLEGILTDKRDGRKYKTVTFSWQTWMAENLNYDILGSYCFGDDSSKCEKYGRLYTWEAAMNACPAGSHLPRIGEWRSLFNDVGWPDDEIVLTPSGTEIVYGVNDSSLVGKVLKSRSGWYGGGNGTDDYGFSIRPAGFRYGGNGVYSAEGIYSIFWSDTLFKNKKDAYAVNLSYYHDKFYWYKESKEMGLSVRCVLDERQVAKVVSPSDVVKGTLVDSRDGRKYNTVTIGTQTWMAENLNYATANSYCFNNDPDKCAAYGRFYTWAAAMDSAGVFGVNGEGCGYKSTCNPLWIYPVQGVCPVGFHLPTTYEWKILFSAVGGKISAGKMLKSTMGWETNGTDDYGFSAIPVGRSSFESGFYFEDSVAIFWSVDDHGGTNSVSLDNDEDAHINRDDARNRYSVRCVKNENSKSGFVHPSSVVKDSVIDSRDGRIYKTVTIGLQTWMAENLSYDVQGSYCYHDSVDNCSKYGRFYPWAIAKDVCPAGFHLPSKEEWETLIKSAGGEEYAYTLLKSRNRTFEENSFLCGRIVDGRDDYGFSVLPLGSRSNDGIFVGNNTCSGNAHFWSSTESESRDSAYFMDFNRDSETYSVGNFVQFENVLRARLKQRDKNYAMPVRCVKD